MSTAQLGPRASILSIHDVGYRHSGTYTCVARNRAGTSFYSTTLKVNGKTNNDRRKEEWGHQKTTNISICETSKFELKFQSHLILSLSPLVVIFSMKANMLKYLAS